MNDKITNGKKFKYSDILSKSFVHFAIVATDHVVITNNVCVSGTGRNLTEKEVDFFIQTAGDDGMIDLGHFTNLLYRLKLYNAPAPK